MLTDIKSTNLSMHFRANRSKDVSLCPLNYFAYYSNYETSVFVSSNNFISYLFNMQYNGRMDLYYDRIAIKFNFTY